jgi:hypothetical protein
MSKENAGTQPTVVVGASGSVGILPGGFFAKILSEPSPKEKPEPSGTQDKAAPR